MQCSNASKELREKREHDFDLHPIFFLKKMLINVLRPLVNNPFKKIFYEKRKKN